MSFASERHIEEAARAELQAAFEAGYEAGTDDACAYETGQKHRVVGRERAFADWMRGRDQ